MSPINITNLLVRIASYNNMANRNANKNVNPQNNLLTNQNLPQQNIQRPVAQNFVQPQQNAVQQQFIQQQTPQQNIAQQQFIQQQTPQQNIVQQQFIQQQIPQQNIIQQQFVQQQTPQQNIIQQQGVNQINSQAETSHILGKAVQTSRIGVNNNIASRIASINTKNQNINYVKEMMNLPQDMKDVLSLIQKAAPSSVQGQSAMISLGNINIKNLTQLIQNGSKSALNQIVDTNIIQNLSKADKKQIAEAISYLNASSSSQESQTQALKNFMLLYLPWLPLEEGTDFELDFTFSEGSEEDDENILNIVIVTRNFGEIHILIILKAMNNFEIYIQCCKKFPKRKLIKLVGEDENKYTLKTNMVFEEQTTFEPKTKAQEAKITLSHVKEISPFLLLIANSLIKYTLLLDSQAANQK